MLFIYYNNIKYNIKYNINMEKYDPYNPNSLDEIFNEIKKEKKIIKENKENKENNLSKESIGMTILKKMGWKGKGIININI